MATVSGKIGSIQVRKVFQRNPENLVEELKRHLKFNLVTPENFTRVKIYKENNPVNEIDEATPESYPIRFISSDCREEVWLSTNAPAITSELLELMGFTASEHARKTVTKRYIELKK